MNALILLATLKRNEPSNTAVLCEFLATRMERRGIGTETVKLVDCNILPGTCSDMGAGDDWPGILTKILAADAIILATPIWWDMHSSLMQRVVERMDELHDEILAGQPSRLDGKVAGIVITGDSDGAQHIIGHLCNFMNAVGVVVPPYGSLSVLWEAQAKGKHPAREELLQKYEKDYAATADKLIDGMLKFSTSAAAS
jgi:multimeric flavodoxin WrbA